jgi:thiol-disulfide isomerase/thioredoxin
VSGLPTGGLGGRDPLARLRALAAGALLTATACAHGPTLAPQELRRALDLQAVGPVAFDPRSLNGKVVLVDFFATWCFPCLADMPHLEDMQKRFGEHGLAVVAVGMDLEGPLVLQPFAEHYAYSFPVLVANGAVRDGRSAFGAIRILPSTVVLGRDGSILASYAGVADEDQLASLLARAVGD